MNNLPVKRYQSTIHGSELERYKGDAREELIQRLTPEELKAYTEMSVILNAEYITVIRHASYSKQILMAHSRNLSASIDLDISNYVDLKQQFDQDNRHQGSGSTTGKGFIGGHRKEVNSIGDTVYPTQLVNIQVKWDAGTLWIFSEKL